MADDLMMARIMFQVDTARAQAQISALQARMAAWSYAASNSMNMVGVAAKGTAMAFAGVTAAGIAATAIVSGYNEALINTASLGDLSAQQTKILSNEIINLSMVYGRSATMIATGTTELAKAGLTQAEIMASLEPISQAMIANNISFAEASDIAIYSVKQFGGEEGFGALPSLMDKIQKVTQETIMDFGDMQQTLQYAGSTAQLVNIPFEQLLAIMGTLSQRAMHVGIAGRSVNQMMINLVENADVMQEWLNSVGIAVEVIKDGQLNLDEIIRAFQGTEMSLTDLTKAFSLFNTNAMRSWGLLITGASEYVKLMDEDIPNAQGTLDRVTQKQMASIKFQVDQMKQVFIAPFLAGEFQTKVAELLTKMRPAILDIAIIMADKLYGFLSWTVQNSDKITGTVKELVEFVGNLVGPLYQVGRWLTFMNGAGLKAYITFKMFQSLGMTQTLLHMATATQTYIVSMKSLEIRKKTLLAYESVLNDAWQEESNSIMMNKIALDLDNVATDVNVSKANMDTVAIANNSKTKRMAKIESEQFTTQKRLEGVALDEHTVKTQRNTQAMITGAMVAAQIIMTNAMMAGATGKFDLTSLLMSGLSGAMYGGMYGLTLGRPVAGAAIGAGASLLLAGASQAVSIATLHKDTGYDEAQKAMLDFSALDRKVRATQNSAFYNQYYETETAATDFGNTTGLRTGRAGIRSVPRTGAYWLHRDETVVPKGEQKPGAGVYIDLRNSMILDDKKLTDRILKELDRRRLNRI